MGVGGRASTGIAAGISQFCLLPANHHSLFVVDASLASLPHARLLVMPSAMYCRQCHVSESLSQLALTVNCQLALKKCYLHDFLTPLDTHNHTTSYL